MSQAAILPKQAGVGAKKKDKVKDLSLGSKSQQFADETRQNKRVLDQLIYEGHNMQSKLKEIGMPLKEIQERFFGSPGQ